ncbi:MAG: dTMP kinase [Nanoarchaeota archaeon]
MLSSNAKFITFEGIDYCGKTTQLNRLKAYLGEKGVPAVFVREPGSTPIGVALRQLLLRPAAAYTALEGALSQYPEFEGVPQDFDNRTGAAELYMFLAARAEFMARVVNPNLEKGIHVVSDRLADSTRAYQGGGRFLSNPETISLINNNNHFALGGRWPDRTFLLDIPIQVMFERKRPGERDYIESAGAAFFERVRQEYLTLAREEPERVVVFDGTQTIDSIFEAGIKPEVNRLFNI